jgi:hypothetical protein
MLQQILTYTLGTNFYLLYIFGIPSLLGVLTTGGLKRCLRYRPALYWTLFTLWAAIAVPFSIWRGGSAEVVWSYFRTALPMLFVIGGLAVTWRRCRLMMFSVAGAAIVNLASSRLFGHLDNNQRLSLDFGTVANSNDYAAHLFLVLPFLLWVVWTSKSWIIRILAFFGIGYGVYLVLATGSRGALVALIVDMLFILFTAAPRRRIALLLLAPIILSTTFMMLPEAAIHRILSFSRQNTEASEEAIESSDARQTLLWDSITCALQNPLTGIGPGQFTLYEGRDEKRGTGGYWHDAHNTFTQVASECGIPAMLLYLAGIFSTMRLLKTTYQQTSERPDLKEITSAMYCMRLAMIGFCASIFFLNFAYFYYFPAMAGLAIAAKSASGQLLSQGSQALSSSEREVGLGAGDVRCLKI